MPAHPGPSPRWPFLGSRAVAQGVLTPRQLRGSTWCRLFPDVYVHRDVEIDHELRARAAVTLLPDAVITGASAAVVWGVPLAGPADDVELTRPRATHPVRVDGLTVRRVDLDPAHVRAAEGMRFTSREMTALRLAGALPLDDAVAAVDQMASVGRADLAAVRRLAGTASGRGSRRAREACALADGLAASHPETRLRLLLVRGPLPDPVAQFAVRHRGRFVARVDFAWPDRRVALEYDGLWHRDPQQFGDDRDRLNRIQAAGWRVVFVTARDLHRPEALLARIADALASVH